MQYIGSEKFDKIQAKLIVPFAAIGIFIGSFTFSYFSEELLKFIVGIMGFLFASHYFLFKKDKIIPTKKNFFKGAIFSTIAGFTSFCVHAGGTAEYIFTSPKIKKRNICWLNKSCIFYIY